MILQNKDPADRVSACPADCEALLHLVSKLGRPLCLEVGAYVGHTAMAMLAGGARHVYSVDLWSGDLAEGEGWHWPIDAAAGRRVFEQFCRRVPLFRRVTPVVGDSLDWAGRWRFPLDLVFIDGDHAYKSCKADIAAWWPHVRPGGILCGHDYCHACPGVIDATAETGPTELLPGTSVWWRRKAEPQGG